MRIHRTLLLAAALVAPWVAAAAPAAGSAAPTGPGTHSGVRWTSDDYLKALSEAKARKVPIFVDAWAPW